MGERKGESFCCPWCTCVRCKELCLRLCCCYEEQLASDSSSKYPHILYGQLVQTQDDSKQFPSEEEPDYESPIQKRYKYPQKYREYAIPPQLGGSGEKLLVREQPRRRAHISPALSTQYEEDNTDADSELSSLSSMEIDSPYDPGVGFVDTGRINPGKRVSLCYIERSPESTLKRGKHLAFPSKKMSINTIRPLDASLLEKLEALKPAISPVMSGIYFSLYFDDRNRMLIAHMTRVINIPTQRPELSSNPFLQIYLLPSKLEVQVCQSVDETHNPVFDSVLRFCNLPLEELRKQMLVIRLYINVNHFVGGMLYSLAEADLMGKRVVQEIEEFDEEEGLRESCPGDILLRLCYHSRTDIVEVLILEVSNLKKHDILRLPNPYVKINQMYHGRRMSKWKTSTKKGTTNPIFNELCQVDVSRMNIEEVQLDVVVMSYDRLGHNNEVGSISFGDIVPHDSGQNHWKRIMIDTNTGINRWHPLISPASSILSRKSSPARTRRSPMPASRDSRFSTALVGASNSDSHI